MIAQALFFALGFLVASLLALMTLPILSRRAERLATQRLRMLVPWSAEEVVAERDAIRAGHAAETRRLEQSIEAQTLQKAEAMSEAGRHAARVVDLEGQRAEALGRIALLEDAHAEAVRAAREAAATLGLEMQLLHDTLGLADSRLILLRDTEARLATAETLVDEQRASIASLETRATGQDLKIRHALAQVAQLGNDLKDAGEAYAAVTGERDVFRADLALLEARREGLEAELATAHDRLAAAERRHLAEAESLEALATRIAAQGREIVDLQARLAQAGPAKADPAAVSGGERDDEAALLRSAVAALAEDLVRYGTRVAEAERQADPIA